MLSLILALADNRVIGRDNDLPWHLPRDLKRFKRLTTGHTLVMGRKTWDSIGRPLPRRRSLVLSRDPSFEAPGAEVFADLASALAATVAGEQVFVIGGASLFAEALPRADRLELTWIHAEVEGDVRCPPLALEDFSLIGEEHHPADERHAHAMTFETWQRRRSSRC